MLGRATGQGGRAGGEARGRAHVSDAAAVDAGEDVLHLAQHRAAVRVQDVNVKGPVEARGCAAVDASIAERGHPAGMDRRGSVYVR